MQKIYQNNFIDNQWDSTNKAYKALTIEGCMYNSLQHLAIIINSDNIFSAQCDEIAQYGDSYVHNYY